MIGILDILVGIVIFIDVYVIIFFRLLLRRDHEQRSGHKESAFDVIFGIPEKSSLGPSGLAARRGYWRALGVLGLCLLYIATTRLLLGDFWQKIT